MDSSCNSEKTITANDPKNDKPKREKYEKIIFVIRGSMVKLLNGWKMSKTIERKLKVFVKTFSVAKAECMNNYVKPSVRSSLDHLSCTLVQRTCV